MQRFFLQTSCLGDLQIILEDKEIFFQLVKVLRSKTDDKVIFFDGIKLIDFVYKITSIDKKNIIFSFIKEINKTTTINSLSLYQAIPNKIDKIELILQKGVEIGYNEFNFFMSQRSQKLRLSESKINRFKRIILESCEQSGRNIITKLNFIDKLNFKDISGNNLYFHTNKLNSKKINKIKFDNKNINIFIGPEGGFTNKEVDNFDEYKFTKVNLGDNILRTETTSIVVGFYIRQSF